MSILIKGMEMPDCCDDCPLFDDNFQSPYWCLALNKHMDVEIYEKHPDCPLIEVPPHGRLIDADAVEENAQKRLLMCSKNDNQFQKPYEVMRAIALAPTIIPSDKDGEA